MKRATLSKEELPDFKKAYRKALAEKKEVFTFKDQEIIVVFAKYVIQHLDSLK